MVNLLNSDVITAHINCNDNIETCEYGIMVLSQFAILRTWVRFPLFARLKEIMQHKCENEGCLNDISRHGKRFCSLACANQNLNQYRKSVEKIKICKLDSCKKEFPAPDRRKVFCSRSCAASFNNTKFPKKEASTLWKDCVGCGIAVYNKKFCNKDCRHSHEIKLWHEGKLDGNTNFGVASFVRIFLERRSGGQCEGIDHRFNARCLETRVLHIDHIDGNWRKTTPENVNFICPTCHTLTPTYGSKNKNLGRMWKQVYNTPRVL